MLSLQEIIFVMLKSVFLNEKDIFCKFLVILDLWKNLFLVLQNAFADLKSLFPEMISFPLELIEGQKMFNQKFLLYFSFQMRFH
jgi:hypothetical protein